MLQLEGSHLCKMGWSPNELRCEFRGVIQMSPRGLLLSLTFYLVEKAGKGYFCVAQGSEITYRMLLYLNLSVGVEGGCGADGEEGVFM